ncbi:MAG: trehalose-phosphatase [Armatimonadetes bacterium]|nr:MAG: trehalose-phosphatase [Armatimonadota bacterium]
MSGHAEGHLIESSLDRALSDLTSFTPLLIASDYDGTLAPIVDDPALAVPDRRTLDGFLQLGSVEGVHVAIVSGRSIDALQTFVGSQPDVILVGNHGSSLRSDDQSETVNHLIEVLTRLSAEFPGTEVEAKPTGAAFHYRHADDADAAEMAARRLAGVAGARVIEGKKVVEAVLGKGDKGSAVADLRTSTGAAAVLFIGDDETDEAVFKTLDPHDIGIKVGGGDTAANHRVNDVRAVAEVFETLVGYLRNDPKV